MNQELIEYLHQFGYLPKSTNELMDKNVVKSAISEFQSMANIPVTGILNYETIEAMQRPRCGCIDKENITVTSGEDFVAHGNVWKKATISYKIENFSLDLDSGRQREIIKTAFQRWSDVVPLTFREVNDNADININFSKGDHGDNSPFDGSGKTLAHAFFPPPNAGNLAGDVHFDEDEKWQDGIGQTGTDLLGVSVHELGHSLGLRHTNVPNSTMNPFYPTPNIPAQDDRDGIKNIYKEHIWLASIYRDLLKRKFDDSGLDFWVKSFYQGVSRENIARGFCYSTEFSQKLASNLYYWLLDRNPDSGGHSDWTNALQNGMSHQAAILGFLTSTEYLTNNKPPNDFVDSLYRRLLNRAPDASGFAHWISVLNNGSAPEVVVNGFINSEEFCTNYIRKLYLDFLRREPDENGLKHYVTKIQSGTSHQDVIANILISEEYRNSVMKWW